MKSMSTSGPFTARRRVRRLGERGVLLVSLLVGMTVMIILLTASVQSWTTIMQRERELELIFRGNQYIIALQQYAKEHGGAYPMELKELLKEGPMRHRYIRQLFRDPFDKEGEWNLLYLAPNGKSAINPNARFPVGGVLGAGGAANRTGLEGLGLSRDRDKKDGFGRGGSGFGGATMNGPIVGVVSKMRERGFRQYYGRHHYDEWEFHVFLRQVADPKRGRGRGIGLNVNPTGQIGVGGGITPAGTAGPGEGPNAKAPPLAGAGGPGN